MELLTIELLNEKANGLLHELEALELIRILENGPAGSGNKKRSEKYWGILTPEQGADLQRHIKEMRNEWDMSTASRLTGLRNR